MKLKAVLFDLDGTLLPMDQDVFTKGYFKLLAKKLVPHGYEPEAIEQWPHGNFAALQAYLKEELDICCVMKE